MSTSNAHTPATTWPVTPLRTSWDDLLEGIDSPEAWAEKRKAVKQRFHDLMLNDAAPETPTDLDVTVEREWDGEGFRIFYISYPVEADERAHAYLAIPDGPVPEGGFPAVVCLHGTTNWGARRTLGLSPAPDDPHVRKVSSRKGLDYARQLVRHGYVTISPEHFCCAARRPKDLRPFDTAAFYRKHPNWSAVGKYMHDSRIACSVLSARPEVNAERLGVTGHSLGGHGSIWLAACDERIRCAAPNCSARTIRENPEPLHWSRNEWYVYFPQLREELLANHRITCDFHEMMSLISPRPLLERLALNDGSMAGQMHRVTLHLKMHELYRLLDAEAAHAFYVFGDGHSNPDQSQACMLTWMDRWLKYGGDAWGASDTTLTPAE